MVYICPKLVALVLTTNRAEQLVRNGDATFHNATKRDMVLSRDIGGKLQEEYAVLPNFRRTLWLHNSTTGRVYLTNSFIEISSSRPDKGAICVVHNGPRSHSDSAGNCGIDDLTPFNTGGITLLGYADLSGIDGLSMPSGALCLAADN
ncbi:hypothetical protein F5884DRAFT_758223 [Xylogone sp. PMI_703]|nr:hypothetical protein F5884DRAFT_758223 [Xylogone sp. PMI_703]